MTNNKKKTKTKTCTPINTKTETKTMKIIDEKNIPTLLNIVTEEVSYTILMTLSTKTQTRRNTDEGVKYWRQRGRQIHCNAIVAI